MKLNKRETAVILAALRNAQNDINRDYGLRDAFPDHFADLDDQTEVTRAEIDDLCERINYGDPPRRILHATAPRSCRCYRCTGKTPR